MSGANVSALRTALDDAKERLAGWERNVEARRAQVEALDGNSSGKDAEAKRDEAWQALRYAKEQVERSEGEVARATKRLAAAEAEAATVERRKQARALSVLSDQITADVRAMEAAFAASLATLAPVMAKMRELSASVPRAAGIANQLPMILGTRLAVLAIEAGLVLPNDPPRFAHDPHRLGRDLRAEIEREFGPQPDTPPPLAAD
ncbi:hypothetical protein [Neoroseomonas oryzicola]|uniref:Uncharacterized protein n=1 Tax=Neoroseomonas oryzicola TaxID=535904 RepID=A0A9X9WIQ5_9PROT|nr:hypothetical protein [Neoroseomonas oryzicola]MBR0660215.1 hypothetical protein [Neoroseomonas oryzicola]NKE16710.1 hypothetical protein [Neoroseomonas oryzicola]